MAQSDSTSSRRWFLTSLAFAPVAVAVASRARAQSDVGATQAASLTAPTCAADDSGATRDSFNYLDQSPHGAAKDCRNCEFWVPAAAGAACGGCTLITGPISPLGYCDVWALAGQMAAEGGVAGPAGATAATASQN